MFVLLQWPSQNKLNHYCHGNITILLTIVSQYKRTLPEVLWSADPAEPIQSPAGLEWDNQSSSSAGPKASGMSPALCPSLLGGAPYRQTYTYTPCQLLMASTQYKWRKVFSYSGYLCVPVRLVAVKDSLETLQMFGEALCQVAEVVQSAEALDLLPGTLRQPTHCRVWQLLDGHPSR